MCNDLIKKEVKKKKKWSCTIFFICWIRKQRWNATNKDGTNRHLWATFKVKMPSAYFSSRIILIFVLSDFHLCLWFPCLPRFSLSKGILSLPFYHNSHELYPRFAKLDTKALKNMDIRKIYRKLKTKIL